VSLLSEDANERSINLAVRIGKVTASEIKKALERILSDLDGKKQNPGMTKNKPEKVKVGRTTKKQLDKQLGEGATLDLKNPDLRMLNSFMKKEGVLFAAEKDGRGGVTLYFKADKINDVTRGIEKYTRKQNKLGRAGPSLRHNLNEARHAAQALNNNRNAERNRNRGGLER